MSPHTISLTPFFLYDCWDEDEVISAAHRSGSGSAAPPGWCINTCCGQTVCYVSQRSFKSVEEVPGGAGGWRVEGCQPSSKAVICSFAQGRGGPRSEPYKMTSCRPHTCMFYPDCQKQTSRGPDVDKWGLCSRPNTDWYLPENTRIDRFAIGDLLSPQIRAGSR